MAGRISDDIKGSRMFMYGAGRTDEELSRPSIGIASTWTEHFPGHNHLDRIAKAVADGVYMGGGTPCTFGTTSTWPKTERKTDKLSQIRFWIFALYSKECESIGVAKANAGEDTLK